MLLVLSCIFFDVPTVCRITVLFLTISVKSFFLKRSPGRICTIHWYGINSLKKYQKFNQTLQ